MRFILTQAERPVRVLEMVSARFPFAVASLAAALIVFCLPVSAQQAGNVSDFPAGMLHVIGTRHTVAPIEIAPDAKTELEFLKVQRAWSERALVVPFRERSKDQPWAAAANDFVDRALKEWPIDRTSPDIAEIAREGQAVLAKGCDDPLVGYLAWWAHWQGTDEYYGSREGFEKWLRVAEKLPGPKALARILASDFLRTDSVVKLGTGNVPQRLAKLTAEVWQDGSYLPEEDFIFLRHVAGDPWQSVFNEHQDKILGALKPVDLPEWVEETLQGVASVHRAWKSRGDGYAGTVTPEGWEGFAKHLKQARNHLVRAWKLRPDQPLAPATMITVTMGGEVDDGDSPRLWFDRAVAAQCDLYPAYVQLAWAWMPRWGGSIESLLELAKACAMTERYDTNVPRGLFIVLGFLNIDHPDFQSIYRDERVAPLVMRVSQGLVAEPSRAGSKRLWNSQMAVYGWLTGDAAAAAKALTECGPEKLPRETIVLLRDIGIDEAILRAEVSILNSPAKEQFVRAEEARDAAQYEVAIQGFRAGAASTDGAAAARLRALADIAEVERKLAAGEWAEIPADPSLAGWTQRTGDWVPTGEGFPSIREALGPVRIVYGARIGANFELRATIDTAGEPEGKWHLGLVFGDQEVKPGSAKWYGAFVRFDKGQKPGMGRMFFRHWVLGLPAVKCPLLPSNEFTMRVEGGKVTWTVNGQRIHERAPVGDISSDARIGFGSFRHFPGITTSLKRLEVRRLETK